MKAPIRWLKEYVDIELPPKRLAERLTMAGIEAEAVAVAGGWEGVVVGLVVALEPHPGADRLRLATVDIGGERLTSVCGAPNVAVGQKVPFAAIGARLIDPESGELVKLRRSKIRGVASEGMVCSERELGVSEDHQGIMVLPGDAPVGMPLDEYLGDTVLHLDVTPNRPDCLSVVGIAREVAALTGKEVRLPQVRYEEEGGDIRGQASVEILDSDLCPRYCASLVTGVRIGPSPQWMQRRLFSCGMRPINNVVDVTNYVMLELGQPLHAFDCERLARSSIIVRRGREGEVMTSLDGVERVLSPDMLVIADAEGAVAIAGVMGGAESEVTEQTQSVLIESANFDPVSLRRTAAGLKMRSEASLRFEKGLSPELPLPALTRATQLMAQLTGGKIARGIIDVYPGAAPPRQIALTAEKARRVLGVDVGAEQMAAVLRSLGYGCEGGGAGALSVTVPYWRTDVRLAEDLVEDVARIIGYDELPTTIPGGALPRWEPDPMSQLKGRLRDCLAGFGLQEVVCYSLTSASAMEKALPGTPLAALKVANPLSVEQECLRVTLRAGLLQTLSANEKHEEGGLRLFELGTVFEPRGDDLPDEHPMLAAVMGGPRWEMSWHGDGGDIDLFDAKGVLEALFERLGVEARFEPVGDLALRPGTAALVTVGGEAVGIIGELHPRVAEDFAIQRATHLFELDVERLLPHTLKPRRYRPVARFPATRRDIAVVVDVEQPSAEVERILKGSPLVVQATLFDIYSGEQVPPGKKSLAYRLLYQSPERTLTDGEVNQEQGRIVERLHRELGATLRA
ncbi:MAG: phenylalanine--tRNA ligase subunit beta [Chloroflexota bacterium]|nr:phenylalanine--tRNA ligase subunit beta [Chloroflexota bacterium]